MKFYLWIDFSTIMVQFRRLSASNIGYSNLHLKVLFRPKFSIKSKISMIFMPRYHQSIWHLWEPDNILQTRWWDKNFHLEKDFVFSMPEITWRISTPHWIRLSARGLSLNYWDIFKMHFRITLKIYRLWSRPETWALKLKITKEVTLKIIVDQGARDWHQI